MLQSLSIRNIVSIARADIDFGKGLNVLTGETGAGKSILLDSLGLALGWRAEGGLMRPHSEQASVTAIFHFDENSTLNRLAAAHDLEIKGALILRRVLSNDGRSKAFVNDQPVSIGFLRAVGALFVEIEGQFAAQGLLESNNHLAFLDSFGAHDDLLKNAAQKWARYQECQKNFDQAKKDYEQAVEEKEFLDDALAELNNLRPEEGEETRLGAQRKLLMSHEKIGEHLAAACEALDKEQGGVMAALSSLRNHVDVLAQQAPDKFSALSSSIESVAIELSDISAQLSSLRSSMEGGEQSLEQIEERLFALKAVARKHKVNGDELPALMTQLEEGRALIEDGAEKMAQLEALRTEAFASFEQTVMSLRDARKQAARRLDKEVTQEFVPLKLENSRFETQCDYLEQENWGERGGERVEFHVSFSQGLAMGAIGKIASGGELSRLMLALRVAAGSVRTPPTLIFDEVDSGIGGAVASAVGERLRRLSQIRQIIVVTHSPQVTAKAQLHFKVIKDGSDKIASTLVRPLSQNERTEEIARMLAGESITPEARQAAQKLQNS